MMRIIDNDNDEDKSIKQCKLMKSIINQLDPWLVLLSLEICFPSKHIVQGCTNYEIEFMMEI
jgi:hypothetical protein